MKQMTNSRTTCVINYAFNIVWLIRVPIVTVSIFLLINAFVLSGVQEILLPCLATMCMLFFGYVVNDILDIEIDMISSPDRPIPSGKISPQSANVICIIFGCLSLIFSFFSRNSYFTLYIVVYAVMFWVYTKYLKRNWIIKNCVTALFFSSLTFVPVIFKINAFTAILPLFIISFVFTLGREILMDMKDVNGDSAVLGSKRMKLEIGKIVSSILVLAAFILMELFFFETYIFRYTLTITTCLFFVLLLRKRKRKIWLCAEIIKLWFLINLSCLYLGV